MQTRAKHKRASGILRAAEALGNLETLVAAVKGRGVRASRFTRALALLKTLSRKEGIPLAIVGGLGAIYHGYERNTKDIDVVVAEAHLDPIIRVAPKYGVKVVWHDPAGWHKLQYEGVAIEVVPEGAKASKSAPTTIPGPRQLGVQQGAGYASLEGWLETKISSGRRVDQADVVQVLKKTDSSAIAQARDHIAGVHRDYLRLFDELHAAAKQEKEQERERGGPR